MFGIYLVVMDRNCLACVSSLDKIFPNEGPSLYQDTYTAFVGEIFHYQIAAYSTELIENLQIEIQSDIREYVKIRVVENLPSAFAVWKEKNDGYVIQNHGNNELYPELLRDVHLRGEDFRPNMWKTFWVTVEGAPIGEHTISVRIHGTGFYEKLFDEETSYRLNVLDACLPKSDLIYTSWMHYDCICDKHNVEPYSEEFYKIAEQYVSSAVRHGLNMLFLPLFTPMLDIYQGGYRKNVQLVKVRTNGDGYDFDFSETEKFMEWAIRQGVAYFELSPLASQWGAEYCPRIIAEKDGQEISLFGWTEKLPSESYKAFLRAFLRAFADFTNEKGYEDKIYFHISDEPQEEALERFGFVKDILVEFFPNAKIMDALSNGEFYRRGIINNPIVAIDAYDDFHADWVYYSGCMRKKYCPNRHFSMPSLRNRVLGWLLYRNGTKGFLHWGFNYYYGGLSEYELDPYCTTDRGGCIESGDCCFVYPTKDGVLESLRHEVFFDAFQDYRALKMLENIIGKEKTIGWLDEKGFKEGFSTYPRSDAEFLKIRLELNQKIMESKKIAED